MQVEIKQADFEELLHEWGRWSRIGVESLDYPGMTAERSMYIVGDAPPGLNISEKEAMRVDRAVARLGAQSRADKRLIMARFVFCRNPSSMARIFRTPRTTLIRHIEIAIKEAMSFYSCD